jgi:hypothetical protein
MKIKEIAKVCHEANRALCESQGDHSQGSWEDAPEWQKGSVIAGVAFNIRNPDALPSASHENWLEEKEASGWTFGTVKDVAKKEHPCFVPYVELPENQKIKDYLFKAIVNTLATSVERFDDL